ncbi:hypothetical protein Tco_1223413, partial [Tanacetum coccineum]
MTKLELFQLRSMWGNFKFDYVYSMARGRFGGLVTIWDPNFFVKKRLWCGDNYIIVDGKWKNSKENFYIIKKSIGEVGSIFSIGDAATFNDIIHATGLIDLPLGEVEFSRRNSLLAELRDLEKKDDGHASDDEKTIRINRLQELDDLEKMESMDLVQKARVNWEGVWISEPKDIKEAFLNFYKDKFSCHDSSISFPPVIPTHRHNTSDLDFLDVMVSMDEIKTEAFVVNFFYTGTFPQGSN